jgi:citrate synthase
MQEWATRDGEPVEIANSLVAMLREKKRRMPGFGHRLHTEDPRTAKLFELAKRNNFNGRHLELALAIEKALEAGMGKKLPLNVDGAIAAVISDLGFDWQLGKAFFIFSRVAGLAAHAYEEKVTQRPMRKLGDVNSQYNGPARRELPTS